MRLRLSETYADGESLYLSPGAWFGITFATFWAALLGHEAAHFAVAHFVYSPGTWARNPRRHLRYSLFLSAQGKTRASAANDYEV